MKAVETGGVFMTAAWSLKEKRLRISSTSPDSEAHCCRDFGRIAGAGRGRSVVCSATMRHN